MSRTVAAVDCGTNSVRLLVLRREDDGSLAELTRLTRLARLGQGVDATGEFHPDALARTFAVLDEYRDVIAAHGVDSTRFVATQPLTFANMRLVAANWLSSNILAYAVVFCVLSILLGIATSGLLRRFGRDS